MSISKIALHFLFVVFLLWILTGCMVGPNYSLPPSKVEKNWVEHKALSTQQHGEAEVYWWKSFHDPILVELIELAYEHNPTLQAAGVNILKERALLNRAIGNLLPQQQGISGSSNYNYIPQSSNFSQNGTANGLLRALTGTNYSTSIGPSFFSNQYFFTSSWEIDFWGKYRRQIQSDKNAYLASVASYDDALVSLIGDVAQDYVLIRTDQEEIRITHENIMLQQESLRIAMVRFKSGQTSQLDVTQAQSELLQTESQISEFENSLQQTKNALALLLGMPPTSIEALLKPGTIPAIPSSLLVGIPNDLLRRRPDVRQAGFAAASKCALIGVQVSNLLPAFSLSGSFGATSSDIAGQQLTNIFNWQNSLVNAANNFTMPVFNYGRLVNQVRVADASFQEAILKYQDHVLNAQKEVENGLSTYYHGRESVHSLAGALTAAKQSTKLATVRYVQGQANYSTVLTALQQQLTVERSFVSQQGSTVMGVVATYRALGGGWQLRNGHDVISEKVKKEMSDRTNWGQMLAAKNHLPLVSPEDRPVNALLKNIPPWNLN